MITLGCTADLVPVSNQLLCAVGWQEKIWCFYGEIGVGKTTLIKTICNQLGVRDNMSSPSFSIVNEYQDNEGNPLYHFDFYRIKNLQEAQSLGLDEYFYSGHYCFIEWPENIQALLPDSYLALQMERKNENVRTVSFQKIEKKC